MFNKRNPMKYFSGNAFARLPLYKLVAGSSAVVLTASIGLGVFAASFVPGQLPEATPTPEPVVTATPVPTPTATPVPDIELLADISVIQQDVGVQLYTMEQTTAESAQTPSPTPSGESDGEETSGKIPLTGVAATVTLTDSEGKTTDYAVDTENGTALAEDVEPGDYTVTIQPIEGYVVPESTTVTVAEKVVYKADVNAVKDKIMQSSQVNESAEDSAVNTAGAAPIAEEVTDTVQYADSAKEEKGRTTVYTAKLSSSGHLLFTDGSESPYLPVYKDGTQELTGAQRDPNVSTNSAMSVWLPGAADSIVNLGSTGRTMSMAHRTSEGTASSDASLLDSGESTPAPETTVSPAPEQSPAPQESTTPAPTTTPDPTAAPTPEPTVTPEPTPEVTATPPPTPAPAPAPTPPTPPPPAPAAHPDPDPDPGAHRHTHAHPGSDGHAGSFPGSHGGLAGRHRSQQAGRVQV